MHAKNVKELLKITYEHKGVIRWHGIAIKAVIVVMFGLAIAVISNALGIK